MLGKVRTVLYFRISSKEPHHETSIDAQIKAAKKQVEEAGIRLGDVTNSRLGIPKTMPPVPPPVSTLGKIHRGKRGNRK